MPTTFPASPAFTVSLDAAGNVDGSFTVHPQSIGATAINWAGVFKWFTTYGPSLITAITALITVFAAPSPPPVAVPPHEEKL